MQYSGLMMMCKSTHLDLIFLGRLGIVSPCTSLGWWLGCLDLYLDVLNCICTWLGWWLGCLDLYLGVLTCTWMSGIVFVLGWVDDLNVLTCTWVSWLVPGCLDLDLYLDVLTCTLVSWLVVSYLHVLTYIWESFGPRLFDAILRILAMYEAQKTPLFRLLHFVRYFY